MPGERIILTLLAQLALILAVTRLMGWIFSRFRQPQILGEILAGILLGPSLLGWVAPHAFGRIFPAETLPILSVLGQIGLMFFVFLMGLQLDSALVGGRSKSTIAIRLVSITFPFVLGLGIALPFYDWSIALFMAIALSATAFPVLARILTERNLHRSQAGLISIASAAAHNLVTWCVLAFLLLIVRHSIQLVIFAAIYLLTMAVLIRPLLARIQMLYQQQDCLGQNMLAAMVLLVLASSFAAQWVGLHALMGSLVLGLLMPRNAQFIRDLTKKFEDFILVFLLPVFFAHVGLNTQIALLNSPQMWAFAIVILLIACIGKIGGGMVAAHFSKLPWRDSAAVGILLNTRGLVLLVILSIGRELQLIPPPLFGIMVLTALITTGMTTPLLNRLDPPRSRIPEQTLTPAQFCILIPISLPKSGGPLVQIADPLIGPTRESGKLLALHLRRPTEHEVFHPPDETESHTALTPLLSQAQARDLPVEPITFVSNDVPSDIAQTAANHSVNLVLMGYHNPIFGKAMLGGTVHRVLTSCPTDIGVFVDRGLRNIDRILIPYLGSPHDILALELAARIVRNTSAQATILHVVPPMSVSAAKSAEAKRTAEKMFDNGSENASIRFQVIEDSSPAGVVLHQAREFDLVIIGVAEEWGLESRLFGWRPEKIARDCPASLLIVRKFCQPQEIPISNPIHSQSTPVDPHVAI